MTEAGTPTVQQCFVAAMKEKMKDYFSVDRFAEAVKLKPTLVVEVMSGKRRPDYAAMQNIASGVGYELDAFLEYGRDMIVRQAELEAIISPDSAGDSKPAPVLKKNQPAGEGPMVRGKPVEEIIEDFGAWARKLVRKDPAMGIWLEKELEILKRTTDPSASRPVLAKPKDVI